MPISAQQVGGRAAGRSPVAVRRAKSQDASPADEPKQMRGRLAHLTPDAAQRTTPQSRLSRRTAEAANAEEVSTSTTRRTQVTFATAATPSDAATPNPRSKSAPSSAVPPVVEAPKKRGRTSKNPLSALGASMKMKRSRIAKAGETTAVTITIKRRGRIPKKITSFAEKFRKMNKKARKAWAKKMQAEAVAKRLTAATAAAADSVDEPMDEQDDEHVEVESQARKQPNKSISSIGTPQSRLRVRTAVQSTVAAVPSPTRTMQRREASTRAAAKFQEDLYSSDEETKEQITAKGSMKRNVVRVPDTEVPDNTCCSDVEMKEATATVTPTRRPKRQATIVAPPTQFLESTDDEADKNDDEYVHRESRRLQTSSRKAGNESRRSGRLAQPAAVSAVARAAQIDDVERSPSLHRSPPRRSGSRVRTDSEKTRKRAQTTDNTVKSTIAPPAAKKVKITVTTTTTGTRSAAASALPRSKRIKVLAAKKGLRGTAIQRDKRLRPKRLLQQIKKIVKAEKVVKKQQKARSASLEVDDKNLTEFAVAARVVDQVFPLLDRKSGEHWDTTVSHLKQLEEEMKREGTMNDFRPAFWDKFESALKAEFKKRSMKVPESAYASLFWKVQQSRSTPSSTTHPSKSCAKLWTKKKKGDHWTVEEVKSVLRFISIGALCELCINPFKLTKCQLRDKECQCTCPKPISSIWKKVKVTKSTVLAKGQTKEQKRKELWDAQFAEMLKHVEKGLKKKLSVEYGDNFKEIFPLHGIPLSKRKDQFGRDAFQKAKELNAVRRDANQCPSFIFAWTSGTEGNLGMPQQWIEDQMTQLSKGTVAHLEQMRKHENKPKKSSCTGDCQGVGHRCCDKSFRCNMTFNKDNLLQSTEGLFPAGIDGQGTPRMVWEQDSSLLACDALCGCSKNCPKRTVERGPQKMLILFKSPDRGWSTRCAEPIVRGEYIFSFAGLIMTQEEIMSGPSQDTNMFFDLTPKGGWVKGDGMSQLTITTCVKANEFKYVNHSCCPNAMICRIYTRRASEHVHAIGLFARQKIPAFQEIIYDYYKADTTFPFSCKCGGYACRG